MSDPEEGFMTLEQLELKKKILLCFKKEFLLHTNWKIKLVDDFIKSHKKENKPCVKQSVLV
jgi:hypothetical protein